MHSLRCPCCGAIRFSNVIGFESVPRSGIFRGSPSDPVEMINLEFEICKGCGLVRQKGSPRASDYRLVNRSTSRQLPSYTNAIIDALMSLGVAKQDLIVEVGANDGAFLEVLASNGFSHLLGVEPSEHLWSLARSKGLLIENDYFGIALADHLVDKHGTAAAVICRHTLEHVPDPLGFMVALSRVCAGGTGVLVIEVPDSAVIPERLMVQDLWDEHLHYFCGDNLRLLAERAGVVVTGVETVPHLDARNLILFCEAGHGSQRSHYGIVSPLAQTALHWESLRMRFNKLKNAISDLLAQVSRPIYLIGASHPQSNFVNFMDIGEYVDFMIDDDPAKQGMYPPLKACNTRIVPTEHFLSSAIRGAVVKTAFGYEHWSSVICERAAHLGMTIIDPETVTQ